MRIYSVRSGTRQRYFFNHTLKFNVMNIKQGQFLTPQQLNSLKAEIKPARRECEYKKGSFGHTITQKFAGFVFLRGVHESKYETIVTP